MYGPDTSVVQISSLLLTDDYSSATDIRGVARFSCIAYIPRGVLLWSSQDAEHCRHQRAFLRGIREYVTRMFAGSEGGPTEMAICLPCCDWRS